MSYPGQNAAPLSFLSNYGFQAPNNTGMPDPVSQTMGYPSAALGMGGGQGLAPNPIDMSGYTLPSFATPGATPNVGQPGGFLSGMLGTKDAPGWGGMALGGASALMNGFMAMKQYGLAKDTLNANKEQFKLNYDAQKKTTNSALEDRQRARVASNAGAYQSVGSYMAQNGI